MNYTLSGNYLTHTEKVFFIYFNYPQTKPIALELELGFKAFFRP